MARLAIIGAGPAGLAAAWRLRDSGIEVVVLEKSRGVFGRATSRTRHGVRIDPGANYLKAEPPEIEDLILRQLPTDDLVQIAGDIWTFDRAGRLQEGDPEQNAAPKWTYRSGLSTLGKLLAASAQAEVQHEKRIVRLARAGAAWSLFDEAGERYEGFDAVLLTPPAPQSWQLLEASRLGRDFELLADALARVPFHSQFAFVFGFESERARPGNFHALLNVDRKHPVAWLSFENDKPGHVPAGQTVIVAQMQPGWSAQHFDDGIDQLAEVACRHAIELLRWQGIAPAWHDAQRWRYAQPTAAAELAQIQSAEPLGLFLAGDSLIGKARLGRALATGLESAARIQAYLH